MKFQPGQSGNPAGRPVGSRNKKTIAVDEMLAEQTEAAVQKILKMAEDGDPTAMRLCMERMSPTGANRRLGLELPRIKSADDADAAVQLVLDAFGREEISIRELTSMLAAIDRLVRVGNHVEQMRFDENFRREADRRDWEIDNHWPPYHDTPAAVALAAGHCICPCRRDQADDQTPCAAKTGKYRDPHSCDANGCVIPVAPAREGNRHGLYSPVNSVGDSSNALARNGNGNGLYFPVNSRANAGEGPARGAADAAPPSPASDRKGETDVEEG
jgi:Family of unknown function (DUF5681)